MDIKKIQDEVYLKTGIRIDASDPLIVILALNEIVLKDISNQCIQVCKSQNATSINQAVSDALVGFKLSRLNGGSDSDFDKAVLKLDIKLAASKHGGFPYKKLAASTIAGCRLVILSGLTHEEATQKTGGFDIQRKAWAIEKLMEENQSFDLQPKELMPLIERLERPRITDDNVLKFAKYFGLFLLGALLMYFFKR